MRVLIVDDEPLARQRLRRLLEAQSGCEVVGEAGSGAEAVRAAQAATPDVVLLDIRMPGMDGIAAARELSRQQPAPAVIFCTAYDEYALAAFDAAAIGYLLKPVARERLQEALAQARRLNRAQLAELDTQAGGGRRQLAATTAHGIETIAVDDVRCLIADQKYVTAQFPGGELVLDESLKQLEQEFGARFLRVHRNALVAVAHVEGLERVGDGSYRVRLRGLSQGPLVSRRLLGDVKKRLKSL